VVAAGNDGRDNSFEHGYATITSPGQRSYVITVGAMKSMGLPLAPTTRSPSYAQRTHAHRHIAKPDIVARHKVISVLAAPNAFIPTHFANDKVPRVITRPRLACLLP